MRVIASAKVDRTEKALVVRYKKILANDSAVSVQITVESIQGIPEHCERCEVTLITFNQEMSASDMRLRVEAEGEARKIECVAWIEEVNS